MGCRQTPDFHHHEVMAHSIGPPRLGEFSEGFLAGKLKSKLRLRCNASRRGISSARTQLC